MEQSLTEAKRRKAIAWAIALTADTTLALEQYELELLEKYALSELSLPQVLDKLDNRIQHILYRSKAVRPFSSDQLTDLLEQSRRWNKEHHITGLLCYSEGSFVQVLEGPAPAVQALYANIQRDPRHQQVVTLSNRASSTRWFGDWRMALVETNPHDFFWLIGFLEAKNSNLVKSQIPIDDTQLTFLLKQFSEGGHTTESSTTKEV